MNKQPDTERRELLRQLQAIARQMLAAQAAGDWQIECLYRAAARDVSVRLARTQTGARRADVMMVVGH